MAYRKILCSFCKQKFLRRTGQINEAEKLGWRQYCSRDCLSEDKLEGAEKVCGNCSKKVYRPLKEIKKSKSGRLFCSSSCAAIVNNQKYPKWPKRYCTECGKEFKNRDSDYCSTKCGYAQNSKNRFTYTREQIIKMIKKYTCENTRVPAKREITEISNKATHMFGSWSNAIIAAGLKPNRSHDNRMYKRIMAKAKDGHLCDSVSEAIIDNWLNENKIPHQRDYPYPETNHKADWAIRNNLFIEYFGLAKDSPKYDRSVRKKKKLCEKLKIKLIEIYPEDLYPKINLNSKLNFFTEGSKLKLEVNT